MAKPHANNNNNSTRIVDNGNINKIIINAAVGPSVYWTRDEQSLLEELLVKYASDSMVMRYAKIAVKLQDKTLKDVALRCRWMIEKENRKQRKKMKEKIEEAAYQQVKQPSTNHSSDEEISYKAQLLEQNDHTINQVSSNGYAFKENGKQTKDNSNSSRKHKEKKIKGKAAYQQVKPSSHATNGLHHADSDEDMDDDDDISYKAIGGAAARLLEQNDQAINQILANISAYKLHENISLESQTRNNINALLYESLYNIPEMKPSARQLYDFQVLRRVKKTLDFPLDK